MGLDDVGQSGKTFERIRSFVLRAGRTTAGQQRAIEELGPQFIIPYQDKNLDFQADSGKARIKTGSDILIESDSKITLKVGGSTIVITPSNITIKSARIDFNP